MNTTDTYSAHLACRNCEWEDNLDLIKGTPISLATCPNCGCTSLLKYMPHYSYNVENTPLHLDGGPGCKTNGSFF